MATIPNLGKLEKVADLRKVWSHEAHSFTPWLAQPENLSQLGDILGLELELEAVEESVGPFKADILCKSVGDDHWVLIENQLEKTDHLHLGQILTYAAGLDAVTIVWISPKFTEEHRACLDWLNRSTIEGLNFFGVQLEVWQIGDSAKAPRFNIVSKPNEWSKSVATASASIVKPETLEMHQSYWAGLMATLKGMDTKIKRDTPAKDNWMTFSPFGKSCFELNAATNKTQKRISVDFYIKGPDADELFQFFLTHQENVESKLGPLHWRDSLPKARAIVKRFDGVDPTDVNDWPNQHALLATELMAFHETFSLLIKEL